MLPFVFDVYSMHRLAPAVPFSPAARNISTLTVSYLSSNSPTRLLYSAMCDGHTYIHKYILYPATREVSFENYFA